MTRLYVAGPMTGYPEWNFPAFEGATAELREAGYEVTSPHEIDLEGGFDPSSDGSGFDLRAALERDVDAVMGSDGVALLEGWEESPGAAIEVLTAESQGIPARPVRAWLACAAAVVAAMLAGFVLGYAAPERGASLEARGELDTDGLRNVVRAQQIQERQDKIEDRLVKVSRGPDNAWTERYEDRLLERWASLERRQDALILKT